MSIHEIRNKINSVEQTKKITNAMKLVAASKMRKARSNMENHKKYDIYNYEIIKNIINSKNKLNHYFFDQHPKINSILIIIISTDRGLCGGLNINIFHKALELIKINKEKNIEINLCVIGSKSHDFFKKINNIKILYNICINKFVEKTNESETILNNMINLFKNHTINKIYIVYNEFINTIKQHAKYKQLLPIIEAKRKNNNINGDYLYEPSADDILDIILNKYIKNIIFSKIFENLACEQASRMIAMQNATDNADEMINSLKIQYNKVRQAKITQELSEIVSGSLAIS